MTMRPDDKQYRAWQAELRAELQAAGARAGRIRIVAELDQLQAERRTVARMAAAGDVAAADLERIDDAIAQAEYDAERLDLIFAEAGLSSAWDER